MDSSELGTCSASATASALSPVRHGKGSWSSSARDHPWIIYLGLPVQHYILVTPATQGLNPNAHVFESKLPTSSASDCSATSWEESGGEVELAQSSSSSSLTIDPHPQPELGAAMAGYHQHQDHQQQQHHNHNHNRGHRQQQPRYSNGDMNKLTGSGDTTVLPCASTSAEQKPSLERPPVSTSPRPTSEDMPYHAAVAAPEPLSMAEGDCEVIGVLADHHHQQQASPQPQHNSDTFIPQDQLKAMLQQQLEYYFSRENLANDTYLISQMDSDQYVPIWTVANFNQIKKLTKDLTLIVEVLRDSPNVQVDEAGEKVRPNHKRCIVILREIPDSTPVEDVEALFKGENCPKFVSCEFAHNNSWYVTFESDEDAQRAYRYLREEVKFFQGKSIMARIKAKPITRASFLPKNGYRPSSAVDPGTAYAQQPRYAAFQPAAAIPSVSYSSQQVPALYAFPPFYPPNMLQTWAPTSHAYFDIGSVFSINGLAPQPAFKPLNGTGRSNYQLLRPRNPKSHLRNQSNYERQDSRSGAVHGTSSSLPTNGFGSCVKGGGGGKASGADNGHAKRDPVGCGGVAAMATPSSPGVPHGAEAVQSPASSTGAESREDAVSQASGSAVFNHADAQTSTAAVQPPRSRHRRRKKEEEGAGISRNEVSKSTVPTKDTKLPLPKFDLEAAAFPPLPGTMDGGNCDAEAFENRMSDVVRGTAKPPTRDSKTQTSAPLSPVAQVAEKEVCVVTNGDDSLDHGFTPPPSPTCPRAAEAVSATDTTTRTDTATTERKEPCAREVEVEDEPRSPAVGDSIKISIPTSPMPTSSKCSPAVPRSPTVNVSPNVPAAVASGKSPNSISQECKTARLSYAQMAQRAKEKVEKMAQEQKERQGALERERKQKERDVTNMAVNVKPGPNSHAKETRNLRERDAVAKGGQRDRYPLDNREQRYRRTNNKMAKDPVTPNPAANQNSDDRERRWERDFSSKLTNSQTGGGWVPPDSPQQQQTATAGHPAD